MHLMFIFCEPFLKNILIFKIAKNTSNFLHVNINNCNIKILGFEPKFIDCTVKFCESTENMNLHSLHFPSLD